MRGHMDPRSTQGKNYAIGYQIKKDQKDGSSKSKFSKEKSLMQMIEEEKERKRNQPSEEVLKS